MNQKGLAKILLTMLIIILAGTVGYFVFSEKYSRPDFTSKLCTMEAKQCQDGSYVSRSGPNCEFAACSAPTSNAENIIKKVGERESSFLIQKINPDSVEGLWYQAYPIEMPEGTPKTLRRGDDIGYTCEGISEKLTNIDFAGQRVTFIKTVGQPPKGGCPICLAGNTLIDTPLGQVPVKNLQVGAPVWTADNSGQRVLGYVVKTSKVPVSQAHKMIHLALADGRELFVSPGHPTSNGRGVEDLKAGDTYDGSSVLNMELVPYGEEATYDILPSGETGFYWANGILMGSTLKYP